jgi:hypothetical protein
MSQCECERDVIVPPECERDVQTAPFEEPSFFNRSTFRMRKVGAKTLLNTIPEFSEIVGLYTAMSVVGEVFTAMLKEREDAGGT